jgi:RNA polymerase sigma-70 factor (ECF subfamily)
MSENLQMHEDRFLLAGLKTGDEAVFRQLFDKFYRPLVVFANRLLSDPDLSRSVVQDVFVMMYDKRSEINIHTSLQSHLFQTVRNRCLNVLKHNKMKREHHQRIFDSGSETEQPAETLEYAELERCLDTVINALPDQCRKIFKLSRYEGVTNQEIADQLDLSKRTVETQISKALKRIREELAKSGLLDSAWFLVFAYFFL